MLKKHKTRSVLAAVLLFCLVCSCFLTFGHTSAYITDSSNTCVNTFTGETQTEPTTEPSTQPSTEPTTQPTTETTTVYVDTSPVSPPTGGECVVTAGCVAVAAALCASICIKELKSKKRR